MKKILVVAMIGIMALTAVSCSKDKKEKTEDGKIKITASIFPVAEVTKAIGGDKVQVQTLVPAGQEPHHFEPNTGAFKELLGSKLFIYNGLGMEEWLDDVSGKLKENNIPMIDASTGVDVLKDGDKIDPHVWLSLKQIQIEAKNIENALIKEDPSNSKYYEDNYNTFINQCNDLYNKYKEKFQSLKNKNFVTGHAAFGYLCRDFGLKQESVSTLFADGEPTPGKLQSLVQYCRENNVKVIFSGTLSEPKTSETLAKEVGAKVVKLYTLESSDDNKTYLEAMEYNLETIYNNLK
ncbi:MAG: metal ABC transporter solute-binding protein, Zn/Mn family [Clostridium sp.]